MAFNVNYSFNNGATTGTATSITQLRSAIYTFGKSNLTQCTLSGTAEGELTTGDIQGTTTGTNFGIFFGCSKLASIDLSNLDTSKVTNMSYMFDSCIVLTELDLSNLDTSNVTDMQSMFNNCQALTSLNLSNWNTSKVTNMNSMFRICKGLTNLDFLSNLNTANVTDMSHMFMNLNLTSIDLSNLDTSSVTDMKYIFYECESLTSLDISNWDTSKVSNMSQMFQDCPNLEHIYVGENWSIDAVTRSVDMFNYCIKLPNFDENKVDVTMAKQTWEGGYLEGIEEPSSSHFINVAKFVSNSNEIAAMYEQEENLL